MLREEEVLEVRIEMLRRGENISTLARKIGVARQTLSNYLLRRYASPVCEKYLKENHLKEYYRKRAI